MQTRTHAYSERADMCRYIVCIEFAAYRQPRADEVSVVRSTLQQRIHWRFVVCFAFSWRCVCCQAVDIIIGNSFVSVSFERCRAKESVWENSEKCHISRAVQYQNVERFKRKQLIGEQQQQQSSNPIKLTHRAIAVEYNIVEFLRLIYYSHLALYSPACECANSLFEAFLCSFELFRCHSEIL